jgi:protein SCO1/2
MKTSRIIAIMVVVAAGAVGIFLGAHGLHMRRSAPPETHAALFKSPRSLPAFSLSSTAGRPLDDQTLAGHWSLLYFGYTHCPDICPTTLALLAHVVRDLRNTGSRKVPRVYFISVDPKRDTLAAMKPYAQSFDPAFVGVSGPVADLRKLTTRLGVAFTYSKPDAKGNYTVNHTAGVFLIGPDGKEVAVFTPPLHQAQMVDDLHKILAYGEPAS